jgi:hypothetical protein
MYQGLSGRPPIQKREQGRAAVSFIIHTIRTDTEAISWKWVENRRRTAIRPSRICHETGPLQSFPFCGKMTMQKVLQ